MTIRITGMNSGLDTESIINELASARSVKVQKIEKNQTKLSWKIDAWKELNTKIYSLYSDVISDMRFDYAYAKKTTKVSNSDAVSVITAGDAMNGVQSLKIKHMAKTGYLTGAKIDASSGDTLLSNIKGMEWLKDSNESVAFKVKVDGKETEIKLTGSNTLNDVVNKFKEAGLDAKFDATSGRFFVASKKTGEAADFTIAPSVREAAEVPDEKVVPPEWSSMDTTARQSWWDGLTADEQQKWTDDWNILTVDEQAIYGNDVQQFAYDTLRKEAIDANNKRDDIIASNNNLPAENAASVSNFSSALKSLGLLTADMAADIEKEYGVTSFTADEIAAGKAANKIKGQDAEIELNGAKFTSDSNTFEINGLTMTIHKETDEEINLTTEQDTSGIYDMIKNFIKKYSELINEMDKLYNAESASKYEPLTKEEKDAMSDTEVEEWEKKIKDSLLRRDTTLSSVSSALKSVMMQTHIPGIEGFNDGKDIYLSSFGIETLGYFKAKDNEKNAYHINGDPDDTAVKNNEDKLKKAIATDPDTVISFFKELANNLYDTLEDKMAKTDYSSSFTVYNDKQMATELKEYDSKIKTEQDKLNDYIDRWYQKFSQMEVALGKLNSQQSSISSLFG